MTPEVALQWVAYAARQPVDVVSDLGLDGEQLSVLGDWLAGNRLLNPPMRKPLKTGEFICQCGCGQPFRALYRTKKPKYVSKAHCQRAYRARTRGLF